MNLLDRRPEDLAERVEPSELLAELRRSSSLDEAQAHVLDVFLNHWIVVVMSRSLDRESVLELLDICECGEALLPESATRAHYLGRWKAFHDLLEGKRRYVRAAQKGRAVALKQEPQILAALSATEEMTQTALARALQLSAGRVSQLLGVLEEQGKVKRVRRGKESFVSALASPALQAVSVDRSTQAANEHRLGMTFLTAPQQVA